MTRRARRAAVHPPSAHRPNPDRADQPAVRPTAEVARAGQVAVRVSPGASVTRVGGSYPGPHGPALVIRVNAPAVDGRATAAAGRALAEALGVPPGAVRLRSGASARMKLFVVDPAPPDLAERVAALLAGEPGR